MRGVKVVLSEAQETWLVENYRNTKNDDICAKLGISVSSLQRIARRMRLKKTPQFMRSMHQNAVEAAIKAIKSETPEQRKRRREIAISNQNPENYFKKGVYALKDKTPEERAEIYRKKAESWTRERNKDIARVSLGLDQKTKFRLPKDFNPKRNKSYQSLRYALKKNGYLIPKKGSMVVFITERTQRNFKRENNGKKLGFIFKFTE